MSLDFRPEFRPTSFFRVTCGCPEVEGLRFETWEEAHAAATALSEEARTPFAGCAMPDVCVEYPLWAAKGDEEAEPELNVNEATAARLMELLGLQGESGRWQAAYRDVEPEPDDTEVAPGIPLTVVDSSGQLPAGDFLGRVLLALALTPQDAGTEGTWRARFSEGGRPAGTLQRHLRVLHELAQWCLIRGRDVTWG